MNDGQYTNLRNYLEEIASLSRQVLGEQKRTNELLSDGRLTANKADNRVKGRGADDGAEALEKAIPDEAVGTVTVETVETVDTGKGDTGKADAKPKKGTVTPRVGWNS
jgi:hypothetical protein